MATMSGVGTILSRGATTPPPAPASDTFTAVGQVRSISGPNIQKEQVEVTSLDSTGGFKEYVSGLKDGGELTFELNFDPANAQHTGILADVVASSANSLRNWRIVWPDTGSFQADFKGEVTSAPLDTKPNEPVTISVTVKISGAVTFTP